MLNFMQRMFGISGFVYGGFSYTVIKENELSYKGDKLTSTDRNKILYHGIYGAACGCMCEVIIPYTFPITLPLYFIYNNTKQFRNKINSNNSK